jgi:type II secretory pathway pseudopilin PulG
MIEVMIALAILLIAAVGALVGIMAASKNLKTGQLHLYQSMLVESAVQRFRLADKRVLIDYANGTQVYPAPPASGGQSNPTAAASWVISSAALDPAVQGIDQGPWAGYKDPWTGQPGTDGADLSTGKFFTISSTGQIVKLTSTTTPAAPAYDQPCSAAPVGTFCREVAIIPGAPSLTPGAINTSPAFQSVTVWIRVSQVSANTTSQLNNAYLAREVIAL